MRGLRTCVPLLLLAACASSQVGERPLPPAQSSPERAAPPAPTSLLRIATTADTLRVRVEVARTESEHERGLMGRESLDPDGGLLFLFASRVPAYTEFWMYDTRFPVDLALADSAGVILAIHRMEACLEAEAKRCPRYRAGVAFHVALETNAGFLAAHGVRTGDRLLLERLEPDPFSR
jgi:uncharacterized protein